MFTGLSQSACSLTEVISCNKTTVKSCSSEEGSEKALFFKNAVRSLSIQDTTCLSLVLRGGETQRQVCVSKPRHDKDLLQAYFPLDRYVGVIIGKFGARVCLTMCLDGEKGEETSQGIFSAGNMNTVCVCIRAKGRTGLHIQQNESIYFYILNDIKCDDKYKTYYKQDSESVTF